MTLFVYRVTEVPTTLTIEPLIAQTLAAIKDSKALQVSIDVGHFANQGRADSLMIAYLLACAREHKNIQFSALPAALRSLLQLYALESVLSIVESPAIA